VFRIPNVLSNDSVLVTDSNTAVDFLLHPSAIRTAPPLCPSPFSGLSDLGSYVQDVLTVPASLAGLPAISVPAGLADDGWPVGVTVVGQWGCDEDVLNIGKVIETQRKNSEEESEFDWNTLVWLPMIAAQ
jgi:aspartyl-tRNA(Asn)/glutamyl-tRNA(Gln) amidotransferase subunit A